MEGIERDKTNKKSKRITVTERASEYSVPHWPGRPRFNPRTSHTKDPKK